MSKRVPKLRFKEFESDGEWEEKRLGELSTKIGDGLHSTPKYDKNGKYSFINGNNLINGKIIISNLTKKVNKTEAIKYEKQLNNKTTILLSINGTIGNLAFYNNEKVVLGKSIAYINIKNNIDINFIFNQLKTYRIKSYFQSELTGSTIKNLSLKTIRNTYLLIPKNLKEQQKIANTLSSLDNLIMSEDKKLQALQTYKKGLMQQLFPKEGERVPKLRFKEFESDEEWEEKKLFQTGEIITGNTPSTRNLDNYGNDFLFISPSDINKMKYISNSKIKLSKQGFRQTRNIEEDSILFVCIGSTIGKIAKNKYKCATNQQINSVVPYKNYHNDFIYYVLDKNATKIANIASYHAIPIINKSEFSQFKILIPTQKEQQKIANTLSSLDNLIENQSKKIETLKEHKKGLMQQMFVSDEER